MFYQWYKDMKADVFYYFVIEKGHVIQIVGKGSEYWFVIYDIVNLKAYELIGENGVIKFSIPETCESYARCIVSNYSPFDVTKMQEDYRIKERDISGYLRAM